MAHGAPDDSNVIRPEGYYRVDDNAELAARLGSILTYRRSGELVFCDDFSYGLQKINNISTSGSASVLPSNKGALSAGIGLCINCPIGGVSDGWASYLIPIPHQTKLGFAVGFDFDNAKGYIELRAIYHSGSETATFKIKWELDTQDLYVYDDTAAWVLVSNAMLLPVSGVVFSQLKLRFDVENFEYVGLDVNGDTYDLSSFSPTLSGSSTTPSLYVQLYVYNPGVQAVNYYFDNLIVTDNEL